MDFDTTNFGCIWRVFGFGQIFEYLNSTFSKNLFYHLNKSGNSHHEMRKTKYRLKLSHIILNKLHFPASDIFF